MLTRKTVDERLSDVLDDRARAFAKLLAAEPMSVDDWPVMKRQMLEDKYAKVMSLYEDD
jgi:hypothetical protein